MILVDLLTKDTFSVCLQAGNAFIANMALSYTVGYVLFQYQFYLLTSGLGHTKMSVREAVKRVGSQCFSEGSHTCDPLRNTATLLATTKHKQINNK